MTTPTANPSAASAPLAQREPRRTEEVLAKVRGYLQENFLYLRPADFVLDEDDRLLDRGVIDSMGVVEMITFIEDTFGVKVAEDEISEANLGTMRAIANFVVDKRGEAD